MQYNNPSNPIINLLLALNDPPRRDYVSIFRVHSVQVVAHGVQSLGLRAGQGQNWQVLRFCGVVVISRVFSIAATTTKLFVACHLRASPNCKVPFLFGVGS